MAAPTKGTELLDLVRKSGLLELPKLDGYVTTLEKEGQVEDDPARLASRLVKDGMITIFQARQMLRGRYRGFFLGKYKVLEPIGSGGMADVYLCEHMAMRHKVAVKILPIEKLKDPSLLGRFRREAQAIATLNHQNVVRAFDLDNEGNLHYLVTEYVDGCNLQDFIKKNGPVSPERAANYIAQAAAGLQHIAESDLVHRDIKPGNLLLDRSGVVKLLDLGLARFSDLDRQDNLTRDFDDGRVLGTADYIAPEQGIKGSDVDIRADIYSLGATFYFLLKGEAPYEGATVTQKLLFHQIKEPPPLPDHVPPDIVELIKHMMAKKPADRVQTPSEVVERLLQYVTEPVPPLEEEMPPRSAALGSQPKSAGPKSSSRLSGRMAMAGHSHPISGPISGRMGPRSGIDPALRSTPHAGVNIPTTPNQLVTPTGQELLDDDDREQSLEFGDETSEAVNTFLMRYKWPLIGGAIAVLILSVAFVVWLIKSVSEFKSPMVNVTKSNVGAQQPEDPGPLKPQDKPAAATGAGLPKWMTVQANKDTPPAKAIQVTSKGGQGTQKTIKSAILAGGSDAHIVIMDPIHLEQFSFEGNLGIRNVTIEGWSTTGQPVVLGYSQTADATKPLVTLSNVSGLKFKNIVLQGNSSDVEVLKCNGESPGLQLSNIGITGFAKKGLLCENLTGSKAQPVKMTRVRSWTTTDIDAAVKLEGTCSEINFEQCRFDGPFRNSISVEGGVTAITMKQCRFSKNHSGISHLPRSESSVSQVTVSNCVFHENSNAGLFFSVPLAQDDSLWTINDNLFLKTKRMALVRNVRVDPPSGITPQWIWVDDGQSADNFNVKPGVRYFRKKLDIDQIPSIAAIHISCKDQYILWINGTKVAESAGRFYDQRVVRKDVTRFLTPGANIIAVQCTNLGIEPGNATGIGPAGLMACLFDGVSNKSLHMTDGTWKAAREAVPNWNSLDIDSNDARWEAAKVWSQNGPLPWKNAVWDQSIVTSIGTNDMSRVKGAGNIRDQESSEGFPNLKAIKAELDPVKSKSFGINADDDATFLRYPKSSFLSKSGTSNKPAGYPQDR